MAFNHRKSVTYRLAQAAKAQRTRSASHLGRVGLHPGQDAVLKALAECDGQTMGELAHSLSVQPPTVTKMIARLGAQGLVSRRASERDGRLARVYLTEEGRQRVGEVDRLWKRLEKEALNGLDDKERKRLRKLLRTIEKNLSQGIGGDEGEEETGEDVVALSDPAAA